MKPGSVGSYITDINQNVTGNLMLQVQVPLLDVTGLQMRVNAWREGKGTQGTGNLVKTIAEENFTRGRRASGDVDPCRLKAFYHAEEYIRDIGSVVHCVSSTYYKIFPQQAARLPGDANSWAKVFSIRPDQSAAQL